MTFTGKAAVSWAVDSSVGRRSWCYGMQDRPIQKTGITVQWFPINSNRCHINKSLFFIEKTYKTNMHLSYHTFPLWTYICRPDDWKEEWKKRLEAYHEDSVAKKWLEHQARLMSLIFRFCSASELVFHFRPMTTTGVTDPSRKTTPTCQMFLSWPSEVIDQLKMHLSSFFYPEIALPSPGNNEI